MDSNWELVGKIGEGTYGIVHLLRHVDRKSTAQVAVKTFKPSKEGEGVSPTAIREIMLLLELRHPNLVRLDGVYVNHADGSLSLAFEYAEHDLNDLLRYHRAYGEQLERERGPGARKGALIPEASLKSLMWQLLNGLHYMHENWVMHRDLKPSNILVMGAESNQMGVVKMGDFGLARVFQEPLRPLTDNGVVVTIWYRSPELLLGAAHYTPAVDLWATGCIFGELLTLKPLFQGLEDKNSHFQKDQCDKIFAALGSPTEEEWPLLASLPHWKDNTGNVRQAKRPRNLHAWAEAVGLTATASPAPPGSLAFDLLTKLLAYDPAQRLTAADALKHPWFSSGVPVEQNSLAGYFAPPGRCGRCPERAVLPCALPPAQSLPHLLDSLEADPRAA